MAQPTVPAAASVFEPPAAGVVLKRVSRPVLRQAVLTLPLAADVGVRLGWGEDRTLTRLYLTGLAVFAAATAAAIAMERARVRPTVIGLVLAVLDMVALGLAQLVPGGSGVAMLGVLPAMWLAADYRLRGVLGATGLTVVCLSVPSIAYFGFVPPWASRAVLEPLVVLIVGLTVAGIVDVWQRQNAQLKEAGEQVTRALGEATERQAFNDAIVQTVDVGLVALNRQGSYQAVNPRQQEFLRLAYPDGHDGHAGQPGLVFEADGITLVSHEEMPSIRALAGERYTDRLIWVGDDPATRRALTVSSGLIRDGEGDEVTSAVLAYKDVTDLIAAVRIRDQFVASVSHELRTPLTSIIGFSELALDDPGLSPQTIQMLQVIRRNGDRLLGLVSDLLFSAQAAEGRLHLDRRLADVGALAEESLADLERQASAKELTVLRSIEPDCCAFIDALRLRQVMDNLIYNAIKYTPAGGEVRVRVARAGDRVEVEVRDDGVGIEEQDKIHLFNPFFRSRDAHTMAIPGIGLGLSIAHTIVKAHEGRIDLVSRVGEGSSFTVSIPAGDPDAGDNGAR